MKALSLSERKAYGFDPISARFDKKKGIEAEKRLKVKF